LLFKYKQRNCATGQNAANFMLLLHHKQPPTRHTNSAGNA